MIQLGQHKTLVMHVSVNVRFYIWETLHVHDIFVNIKIMGTKIPWSHSMFYLPLLERGGKAPHCPISRCLWEIYSLTNSFLERGDYLQYAKLISLLFKIIHHSSCCGTLPRWPLKSSASVGQKIFAYNFIISSVSLCNLDNHTYLWRLKYILLSFQIKSPNRKNIKASSYLFNCQDISVWLSALFSFDTDSVF